MLKVGDVVKLKSKYRSGFTYALIVKINSFGMRDNWIIFDYTVMTDMGDLINIAETCIEEVYSSLG